MWTETHHYRFPDQATAEGMELPQLTAIDPVGVYGEQPGWLVNARWRGTEPEAWEAYRIPDPNNPVRVFL
jgi:hypothetical protein